MITSQIKKKLPGLFAGSLLLALCMVTYTPVSVSAQSDTSSTSTPTAVSDTPKIGLGQKLKLKGTIAKSDKDIDARIASLNTLNTKVQAMKNVSSAEKADLSNEIQANISTLTTAKAKVENDPLLATARADAASALNSTRIYALVMPKGYVEVAADGVNTISDNMTALVKKLQARVDKTKSAGKDVSALQTAIDDISTQITTAKAQAALAQNTVANLVPDKNNQALEDANTAAIKSARGNIQTARLALGVARKDINTVTNGLKALNPKSTTGNSNKTGKKGKKGSGTASSTASSTPSH